MKMNRIKYALAVAATSPLALLAEEGTGSGGSSTADVASSVSEVLSGQLSSASGVVVTLIVAGVTIWAGIAIVGLLKRAFNAGKGR